MKNDDRMAGDRLRCFVERSGTHSCTAYCVDLDLTARGRNCSEARVALDALLERHWLEQEQASRRARAAARGRVAWRYFLARVRSACTDARDDIAICYLFRTPPEPVLGLA